MQAYRLFRCNAGFRRHLIQAGASLAAVHNRDLEGPALVLDGLRAGE